MKPVSIDPIGSHPVGLTPPPRTGGRNAWCYCPALSAILLLLCCGIGRGGAVQNVSETSAAIEAALTRAGQNRREIELALRLTPSAHREGMEFLIVNMPDRDLKSLTARFLTENVSVAYQGLDHAPWKSRIPRQLFLNDILPYACLNEKRDDSRKFLQAKAAPLVADCESPAEAAQRLNQRLFPLLNAHYSTERKRPDQSPLETVESGKATCSGLSILLVDACRSVGIPARVVGTPMWTNMRGNHTWVEIWDGDWHFAGAAEPESAGLDRGWFSGDAAKAKAEIPLHAIYASSFKATGLSFPLVWAPGIRWVNAVNVTNRYLPEHSGADSGKGRLLIKVMDRNGKRISAAVTVTANGSVASAFSGVSKGESADLNDILSVPVLRMCPAPKYTIHVEYRGRTVNQEVKAGATPEDLVVITVR